MVRQFSFRVKVNCCRSLLNAFLVQLWQIVQHIPTGDIRRQGNFKRGTDKERSVTVNRTLFVIIHEETERLLVALLHGIYFFFGASVFAGAALSSLKAASHLSITDLSSSVFALAPIGSLAIKSLADWRPSVNAF